MKAVPKVNIDGLFLEDELVDDAFTGVVPFYAPEPELPPETDPAPEDAPEQPEDDPEPEIAGYIVGVPVPPGLYLPRFDLDTWQTYQNAVTAAEADYRAAYAEWASQPEDELGEPPVFVPPKQPELWTEGLTPEEIAALHPPAEPTEIELLQADVADIRVQTEQQQEQIETAGAELERVKSDGADVKQVFDMLGAEQVKQDLTVLDLKQQNAVIGAELVKKDLAIYDLTMQNQVLGQMLAALELKILAKGTGGEEDV